MMKSGGLGAVREKDDRVVGVVEKIKPLFEEKTNKRYESLEVIHYKTQVVAGTNFFVKVSLAIAIRAGFTEQYLLI